MPPTYSSHGIGFIKNNWYYLTSIRVAPSEYLFVLLLVALIMPQPLRMDAINGFFLSQKVRIVVQQRSLRYILTLDKTIISILDTSNENKEEYSKQLNSTQECYSYYPCV